MVHSSLRRNVAAVAGLYGACLLAAMVLSSSNSGVEQSAQAAPGDNVRTARSTATKPAEPGKTPSSEAKPKLDPIAVNGKFFQGWPKPKLALVISGRQDGYLEPCGCAGLDNQKGGLGRRHALLKDLAARGWPVAAVDVGGLVRRFGKQAELELATSAEAYRAMGYGAVGFGPNDLRLSAGEVAAAVAGADPDKSIFVAANVSVLGLTPQFRIVTAGDVKLGVTAVLGAEEQKKVSNAEVELTAAADALKQVIPQLKDCDQRILLSHASLAETNELAKAFPQFDVVVTSDGADEPPAQAARVPGSKATLVEVGHKGMFVVVLGFYDDPQQPLRYQRVALDSRYAGTRDIHKLMASYQAQLRELGWEGLKLKAAAHPRARDKDAASGQFVGAESCKKCHPTAWGIWSKTHHAQATATLTRLDPPRQFDPQCISCHSTGWNAQEYSPYATGYVSQRETPHLMGNQCENCHGPGAAHVAAENGKNSIKKETHRATMKLSVGQAWQNVCVRCHDMDNSPDFHNEGAFEEYWKKVEHKGKR